MNTTLVNLQEEYAKTEISKILNILNQELVGLAPVKSRIREIAALLLIDKLRKNLGISTNSPGLHMSFTGSPGTGKTTVGLKMADILFQLGYVAKGHLLTVTRDDLVGQYIGHTAPKTKEVLKNYGKGDIIEGEITGIADFGAFIKFPIPAKDDEESIEGLMINPSFVEI